MVSLSGKLQICAVITKLFLLLMWRSHLHLNSSEHFPLLPHVSLALWDVRRQTLQVFCSAALLRGKYDCCSLWMKCLFLEELHTHSYFLYPACCVGWISLSTEENKGLNSDRERESNERLILSYTALDYATTFSQVNEAIEARWRSLWKDSDHSKCCCSIQKFFLFIIIGDGSCWIGLVITRYITIISCNLLPSVQYYNSTELHYKNRLKR